MNYAYARDGVYSILSFHDISDPKFNLITVHATVICEYKAIN